MCLINDRVATLPGRLAQGGGEPRLDLCRMSQAGSEQFFTLSLCTNSEISKAYFHPTHAPLPVLG